MPIARRLLKPVIVATVPQERIERALDWNANIPIRFINVLFQRLLRLNHECPFPVNFTSRIIGAAGLHVHPSVRRYFATSGGCYFQAINHIWIAEGTIIAPGVKIISANHDQQELARHVPAEPIVIGKRCWLGANSVVLPGTVLGDDVVVGAGAVVRGRFESRSVIGGVPARVVGTAPQR